MDTETPTTPPVEPSAQAMKAAEEIADIQDLGIHVTDTRTSGWHTERVNEQQLARIIDSSFAELRSAAVDAHDFIHELHKATVGENRINKDSVLRFGERLKTTAAKLDARLTKALKPTTHGAGRGK